MNGLSETDAEKGLGLTTVRNSAQNQCRNQFKIFDRDSYRNIQLRIAQASKDYGFVPKRATQLQDGAVLQAQFEPVPGHIFGRPVEDFDGISFEKTFCIISTRFSHHYINRFSATRALFIFAPWNPIRRAVLFVSTNQYFDYFVILTILVNCVFLALTSPVEEAEFVFLTIYTTEMIIKVIAKGFILNRFTYLRSAWNWLDFTVIILGFVTIFVELGNLSGLRTFRVLRALKTVSILPGLKTIVNALLHSVTMLTEVMALTVFCLMVFALFGLQIFMGVLRNKCVQNMPFDHVNGSDYQSFIADEQNWHQEQEEFQVCGNSSGAWSCPSNYTCLPDIGDNPNFGYSSFDNFGWAMLTTFQLITLDFWENIYNRILATCGPSSVIFFVFVVFFGSFYLINLMLAVVASSYEEEVNNTKAESNNLLSGDKKTSTGNKRSPKKKRIIMTRRGAITVSTREEPPKPQEIPKKTKKKKRNSEQEKLKSTPEDDSESVGTSLTKTHNGGIQMQNDQETTQNDQEIVQNDQEIVQNDQENMQNDQETEHTHRNVEPLSDIAEENAKEYNKDTVNDHDMIPGMTIETPANNKQNHILGSQFANGSANNVTGLGNADSIQNAENSWSHNRVTKNAKAILSPLKLTDARTNGKKKSHVNSPSKPAIYKDRPPTPVYVVSQKIIPDRNCGCCQVCCCQYRCWLKFQNVLYVIVKDAFFELFITLCIVFNTAFLAAEHHGMSQTTRAVLSAGNKVFTVIFTLEAVLKCMAMSKEYLQNGWNIFDLIAVIGSLIDLSFENFNGLSVLRALRLLRVFKLAQSWTTMKVLLSIILSTIGALGNLTFVLIIIMYIFAVLGMQLFGSNYRAENFYPEPVPRWNFRDFPHAFLMIFRVLCGEWIEPLFDCMRSSGNGGQACIALFLPALIVGNFLVLNLFLALLLSSFNSDKLSTGNNKQDEEVSRLEKGIRRLKSLLTCCCFKRSNAIRPLSRENSMASYQPSDTSKDHADNQESKLNDGGSPAKSDTTSSSGESAESREVTWQPVVTYVDSLVFGSANYRNSSVQQGFINTVSENGETSPENAVGHPGQGILHRTASLPTLQSEQGHGSRSGDHETPNSSQSATINHSSSMGDDEEEEVQIPLEDRWPEDCFPESCYTKCCCCSSLLASQAGQIWFLFRKSTLQLVDYPAFEWIILALILASSISLCFEDVYLESNKQLQIILYYMNIIFTVLFTLEMLLKWIAHGFFVYFTNVWTILDFIIVLVSIFSLVVENSANLTALRSMRTMRALRPLRAISKWQGMKIVVNALVSSIPSIVNVLLVCVVFWLVFSIMGVQFFAGKFYKCVDEEGERLPVDEVNNKSECLLNNYTWENSNVNFDHVGQGYLALFQVATFEGWMEIMADASDAREVDQQPLYESNMAAYAYFVIFIVCGSFFTLNLFIGVIIDNFNMLKKKYEGGVLDMFLTESQKNYYAAMKKLGRKKPQKLIRRPKNKLQILFYNLCMSRRFEMAIFIVIMLNMLSMGVEHYNQPPEVDLALEITNMIFTGLFTLEALIKILAFRQFYFMIPWNIFDFVLVITSILGIVLRDLLTGFFISPTLLRVIRVFRIGRVLRLIKAAKGIRKLIFALMVSLPALFNIGALLFLIMFIYAIMGMSLFGYVKHQEAINDMINFETFGNSMLLLFRLITSAGWSDMLGPLMVSPPECDAQYRNLPNGDCGNPTFAVIYLVSYIIINYMIVINMYIAVILENFNQAHQEEELGIVEEDLEMFYVNWANFDPQATQFIPLNKLSEFLDSLDPPLRVPKPNIIALVSFDVPIARGDIIHCLDILHALIKKVLGHVDETADFLKIRKQMEEKFKKQFPSRKRVAIVSSTIHWKRQDLAARIIQRAFRRWKGYYLKPLQVPVSRNSREMSLSRNSLRKFTATSRFRRLSSLMSLQSAGRGISPSASTATSSLDVNEEKQKPQSGKKLEKCEETAENCSGDRPFSGNSSIFYVLPEG